MSVKVEQNQDPIYVRMLVCRRHSLKYLYKCTNLSCPNPFACPNSECLDLHFHGGEEMHLSKIDSTSLLAKLKAVSSSSSLLLQQALLMKEETSELDSAATTLLTETKTYYQSCEQLAKEFENALTTAAINTLYHIHSMQQGLQLKLNHLKNQVKLPEQNTQSNRLQKQMQRRKTLFEFIKQKIPYDNEPVLVYSSIKDSLTVEKFHERLCGRKRLIFIIFGKNIVGSYYEVGYPSLGERRKKDVNSFLFYSEREGEYSTYSARNDAEWHISLSEKVMICHGNTSAGDGIYSFHRNDITYYLPSKTYEGSVSHDGTFPIEQIAVYQITQEDTTTD